MEEGGGRSETWNTRIGDLCSTLADDERDRNVVYAKSIMHFWEYVCDNWSTEWVHFALLSTDVEAFFN